MGIAGANEPWALLLSAPPVLMLHVAFRGHLLADRARRRLAGLFRTAVQPQASIGAGEVVDAVVAATAEMLECNAVRLDEQPPGPGEIGAPVSIPGRPDRWLVAGGKRGIGELGDDDRDLLQATTAIAAAALANAHLYERAEQERKKLADVLTSSSDGIFSVDAEQRIQSWNPAMERITGFAAGDIVGSRCFTSFRPRDRDGTELCIGSCPGRCGRTGTPVEMQVTTMSGERRWLMSTYSPLPEGGYGVIARDVTAEREVEELKADFLATVSHELRTPLTPIKGFLQTLISAEGALTDDMRMDIYDVMLKQAVRLERLVGDLLDATSLGDPNSLLLTEELEWDGTVAEVIALFRRENPDRELTLIVDDALPPVVADEQRAEQVLTNLLSNAVKYSPPGSPVVVTVEARGTHVATTVVDAGPGIAPQHREAIFQRFRRLGNHLVRPTGGVGLGLYIGLHLAEAMGGTLTVADAPGGGAAFTFTLPVAPRRAEVAP
jgi:PAS domain S-box-containing protein